MVLAIELGIVLCVLAALYVIQGNKNKKKEIVSVFDFDNNHKKTIQKETVKSKKSVKPNVERALRIYTRLAETIPAFNLYVGVQNQLHQLLAMIKNNELDALDYIHLEDAVIKDLLESPLVEARDFGSELSIIKESLTH